MLDGVVRDLTATIGINEVLTNVTRFNTVCGSGSSQRSVSKGAIAGTLLQLLLRCNAKWTLCTLVGTICSKHCIYDLGPFLQ